MGNSETGESTSCCQPDVSTTSESLDRSSIKGSLHLTPATYERIRRRKISLEEAKTHNKDAISKLKLLILTPDPAPSLTSDVQIQRIQQVMSTAKRLRLKVLSSNSLQKSSVINITPIGYDHSLRGVMDGNTYFGTQERGGNKGHLQGEVVNDFVIPVEGETWQGRQFRVSFDAETQGYRLKDLGCGPGVYTKVETALALKRPLILHIGESFLLPSTLSRPNLKDFPRLQLKVLGGNCCGEIFYFNATEYYDKKIRIGRAAYCEVHIDDSLISKVQACVFFNTVEGWILADGDMDTQRPSTNGTWLYAAEEVELGSGLTFKANQTLFQTLLV